MLACVGELRLEAVQLLVHPQLPPRPAPRLRGSRGARRPGSCGGSRGSAMAGAGAARSAPERGEARSRPRASPLLRGEARGAWRRPRPHPRHSAGGAGAWRTPRPPLPRDCPIRTREATAPARRGMRNSPWPAARAVELAGPAGSSWPSRCVPASPRHVTAFREKLPARTPPSLPLHPTQTVRLGVTCSVTSGHVRVTPGHVRATSGHVWSRLVTCESVLVTS